MGKPEKFDFSGWATKYNVKCSYGRTILKHAFKDDDTKVIPLVWNHNHVEADNVLGHAYLEERDEGIYAYCSLNDTDQGKNAKELVQHGDITSLSIFANKLKQNSNKEVMHGIIREVSLVLAGANPGASIDYVVAHADDSESEEATIYNDENALEMFHAEKEEGKGEHEMENNPNPNPNETLEHKEENSAPAKEKTVQEIIDSMSDEQKDVLYLLVGAAAEEAKNGGKEEMKHNAFDEITNDKGEVLTHSEFVEIIAEAKQKGSVKDAFLAHGITDIGNLFPEDKAVGGPATVSRNMDWVAKVMGAVHHTPFARVKSSLIDITGEQARAKGYVKGNQKVEEVVAALKRSTSPQTVYKLQKIDRDDVIDITDFDVIAYLKSEMRVMLDEELARAFLIGDGRSVDSNDKINPLNIRPVWGDSETYTVKRVLERAEGASDEAFAKAFIKDVIRARKLYKGSGNPTLFTTEDMLTNMLLIEDKNERVIYDTVEKLKTALRVSDIVTVEVMEGANRRDGSYQYNLLGLLVNMRDYNVGADKGGNVNMFDDFDINLNKYEYLIETRCSGALVKPFSAISFEEKTSF
jgi:HK97 family phage prohead protease